ncbi:unnamed protein product [Nippostrongylus brasiliensis]|uniref:Secreted RxLR effector peptide protein n=1 Tax=Nippostrongylus brasiliensis TaxID=27835 RepID=A0A0N4XVH4_NIPBR|nr:unnamed protein product [Nippostrongylus brasiliensis]
MKPVLTAFLLVATIVAEIAAEPNDMLTLHRISRSSLPLSALLVPYPRVGKRSSLNTETNAEYSPSSMGKRLYVARVGKRAYMYTARVGK